MLTGFIVPGGLLLLTVTFGLWLRRSGRPFNPSLFNIHKLLALAAVVVFIIRFSRSLRGAEIQVAIMLMFILSSLSVVTLFVSGALMSMGKTNQARLLVVHRIAAAAAAMTVTIAVYHLV